MPTYEYACPKCGIVEAFQSIKEDAYTKCPQCKKAKVQRMISGGGGVIFKGSGFWETDYNRSSDYQKQAKSESGTPEAAPAKTDAAAKVDAPKTPAKSDSPQTQAQPAPAPAKTDP